MEHDLCKCSRKCASDQSRRPSIVCWAFSRVKRPICAREEVVSKMQVELFHERCDDREGQVPQHQVRPRERELRQQEVQPDELQACSDLHRMSQQVVRKCLVRAGAAAEFDAVVASDAGPAACTEKACSPSRPRWPPERSSSKCPRRRAPSRTAASRWPRTQDQRSRQVLVRPLSAEQEPCRLTA